MDIFAINIWGIGFSLLMPTITTVATEKAPNELRAGVMSVFSMMIYLGQTVSPPMFALILGGFDLSAVFLAASIITLLPIIYTIFQYFIDKRKTASGI